MIGLAQTGSSTGSIGDRGSVSGDFVGAMAVRTVAVGAAMLMIGGLLVATSATARAEDAAATAVKAKKPKAGKPAKAEAAAAPSKAVPPEAAELLAKLPKGTSQADIDRIIARFGTVSRLDGKVGVKGWDIPYPGYDDSILGDAGGFRSKLAEYGLGFTMNSTFIGGWNMLDVPRSGYNNYGLPAGPIGRNGNASKLQYWGQQPSAMNATNVYLTYDTSRWGVPDGQILVQGTYSNSSWEGFAPNQLALSGVSWYQTAFDKKLEIKIGYIPNSIEWIGTIVGGNVASPLGSAATVPFQMGISATPSTQPTARFTWHFNEAVYNQFGVMRSLPIKGLTQNTLLDNAIYNPDGLRFNVPNGGTLLMDEVGLKIPAIPGYHGTWVRAGVMHNTSEFPDYKNALLGGTRDGTTSYYAAADYQLVQFDPSSLFTAHRGFYLGGTAMYGSDRTLAFNEYYELRAYVIGPFASRPKDQFSIVAYYNGISKYARDYVNFFDDNYFTGVRANRSSSSVLGLYTANLSPGVYGTFGVAYTDHPSLTYTKNEGQSLNLVGSLFMNF